MGDIDDMTAGNIVQIRPTTARADSRLNEGLANTDLNILDLYRDHDYGENPKTGPIENYKSRADNILSRMRQSGSGGGHTAPESRILMYALAVSLRARIVVELGYDQGTTTEALAWSGAHVIGIDSRMVGGASDYAVRLLRSYPNVTLLSCNAMTFLKTREDGSTDMVFIDDSHNSLHVTNEAKEVRRILRPGGVAVFHDTVYHPLWAVIEEAFPDWQRINLPARSPYKGMDECDMGLGVVRKPEEL